MFYVNNTEVMKCTLYRNVIGISIYYNIILKDA